MDKITDPSRKMLDHMIPAWAESEAAYFITVCSRERGKNTLAFPHVAKIIFDAVQAYEQRKIWFVRFMLLMPDHLHGIFDFPLEASMQASSQTGRGFFHGCIVFAFSAIFSIIDYVQLKVFAKR